MNQKFLNPVITAGLVTFFTLSGCSMQKDQSGTGSKVTSQAISIPPTATGNPADQKGLDGVPGASVPTGQAIIARIQNGVKNVAVPTAGNFLKAVTQMKSGLPQNTNPLIATGFDQVPLLAYAACSDVPLATYGITGNSIPNAKAALVAAGVNIVDQHTGGLGSTGPNAAQVSAIFAKLVDDNAKVAGETVQIAFISVCTAASTFGANMLGF